MFEDAGVGDDGGGEPQSGGDAVGEPAAAEADAISCTEMALTAGPQDAAEKAKEEVVQLRVGHVLYCLLCVAFDVRCSDVICACRGSWTNYRGSYGRPRRTTLDGLR